MKEVKSPKKPLIYYYCIVLLIVFLFNLLVTPLMSTNQVKEVDYGTFMDMIDSPCVHGFSAGILSHFGEKGEKKVRFGGEKPVIPYLMKPSRPRADIPPFRIPFSVSARISRSGTPAGQPSHKGWRKRLRKWAAPPDIFP